MKKLSLVSFACLLLFTATIASAQSRRQPFKFQLTVVDAKTLKPRSTFVLGESVAVRFSLTNQSGVARKIPVLPDTSIAIKLHSTEPYENDPRVIEGHFGGTAYTRQIGDMFVWGERAPRMMSLAPGQTVSTVMYLDGREGHPPDEGTHTLTANYNSRTRAVVSFQVIVDEAKSIPLLEKLAATPVHNGRDTLQRWASATLNLTRAPSISGRILDADGKPLKEDVRVEVTGTQKFDIEARKNGRYRIELLADHGTYTLKPSLPYYNHSGVSDYTFEPASKTISILNGKVTEVNFIARRIRPEKNVALEDEGAKATASSIKDHDFETENVIDGFRSVDAWGSGNDGWNDGTPNVFPDWIEVDFGGVRRINWINVFTLPDDFKDERDPELNQTFSLYGITDFDVQYWTGRAWRNVPNGAIRDNRNVWRKISFPELATNKIRVVVHNALRGESRITEIEAIHVNDLPTAKITVDRARAYTNSPVHFRIDAFDRDGKLQKVELDFGDTIYEWKFDHQKPNDKPQLTHSHVYTSEKTYTVKLRVIDDSDESSETTLVVTITDPPETKAAQTSRK